MIALSILLLVGSFSGLSWTFIFIANAFILALSLFDVLAIPKKQQLQFKRVIPNEMERGISYQVHIEITNHSGYEMNYCIIDDVPQSFIKKFPLYGKVQRDSNMVTSYQTIAPVRGDYKLQNLSIRYKSKLGLWEKQATIPLEDDVKVIPDLTETKQYLESAQQFLLHEGIKIRKQKSGVGEFSKIRSYVVGDDPRKINWRQTAKQQEVMTNEYEPEHGKHITLLIDCGRMMGAELKQGNRLERSIESAITVAAAALKNGDYVSVLAFSKTVKVFVPAGKGMTHLQTILHSIYNLEVDASESNYAAVLQYLQTVQKKRSFLLLFSDIATFLYEESSLSFLLRLRKRHMFLMIGIEDDILRNKVREEPLNVQTAMMKSIAQQQVLQKKQGRIKWERQGLQMIEAREEALAATAVSYYIDYINRGLL